MAQLVWDQVGSRVYEMGVDRGVLYPNGSDGVAWNGLISVTENPSGGEPTPYYLDGVKYLNISAPEEFEATIEAFTYPDEFAECDGTFYEESGLGYGQQVRTQFSMTYRTMIGNDTNGQNHAYKIHFVYNALATPSEKAYATVGDSPEAMTLSWGITTTPVFVPERKPTAHLILDSRKAAPHAIIDLEEIMYGTTDAPPRMPTVSELISIFGTGLFELVPQTLTGMAALVPDEQNPDLKGNVDTGGLYTKTADTKLAPTIYPGLYTRES